MAGAGFAALLTRVTIAGTEAMRQFVDRALEPLVTYDRAHRTDLLKSVRVFLAAGVNATQAARELFIHLNTMTKRLDRVSQILGPDWQREPVSLQLRLALHLLDVSGADPVNPQAE